MHGFSHFSVLDTVFIVLNGGICFYVVTDKNYIYVLILYAIFFVSLFLKFNLIYPFCSSMILSARSQSTSWHQISVKIIIMCHFIPH